MHINASGTHQLLCSNFYSASYGLVGPDPPDPAYNKITYA